MTKPPRQDSLLAGAHSPFLRHGATQPVQWHPWGREAFERARSENRPVLLDIGAVWCHWCHVMDDESYDDPETAALINELFVAVKVDRDESPDVDARYQRAVQALTGQGGWPLTAFLTPDGEVFYGGTYFPPEERHGRPSFRRVLTEVARIWQQDPARAEEAAHGVRTRLDEYAQAESAPGALDPAMIDGTLDELAHSFDFRHGGFGRAPKFPNAGGLDLLLDEFLDHGIDWAQRITTETLHAMARGGIHDQLGGGFHRYATDARWLVPHFEKMASDNGVLLATYARAGAAFDDPALAEVAARIVSHYVDVAPDLVRAGGFPASQDADLGPGDDGSYWTWTLEEVRSALGGDERQVAIAIARYGLDDSASSMHLDPSRHVLHRSAGIDTIARRFELAPADAVREVEGIERTLKAVRDTRPRPFVDESLYAGMVALVAGGHLAAARYLAIPHALDRAIAALDRLHGEAFRADRGVARRIGDAESGEFLEDQAYTASAELDAYEITQQEVHLQRAEALVRVLLGRFADPEHGGFTDRPHDAPAVVRMQGQPYRPVADAPSPAGNAVAALLLFRLSHLVGDDLYAEHAMTTLRAFAGAAQRLGPSAATYMKALAWMARPVTTVVLVEPPDGPLLPAALGVYRPRMVVRRLDPDDARPARLPAPLAAMISAESPRAYVCVGTSCAAPVADPQDLVRLLRSYRA
jgi:uncharacterized protein